MALTIVVPVDEDLAKKMLENAVKPKKADVDACEKMLENDLKFAESDYEISIDKSGRIAAKGAASLVAVTRTGKTIRTWLRASSADTINANYPEIKEVLKKLVPLNILSVIHGDQTGVFDVTITPETASYMLLCNTNNRKISTTHINDLIVQLKHGCWYGCNCQEIGFSAEGVMTDGQHRCLACVLADIPMKGMDIRGKTPQNSTIDSGLKRSLKAQAVNTGVTLYNEATTNCWYRMMNGGKHLNPTADLAMDLNLKQSEIMQENRIIFSAKKTDISMGSGYKFAMLVLLKSREFGGDPDTIVRIHTFLNNNTRLGPKMEKKLIVMKRKMQEGRGEFKFGVSASQRDHEMCYAVLANLIPLLRNNGKPWNILDPVDREKPGAEKDDPKLNREKIRQFIEDAMRADYEEVCKGYGRHTAA